MGEARRYDWRYFNLLDLNRGTSFEKGLLLFHQNKFGEAEIVFDKLLIAEPNNLENRKYLAMNLQRLSKFEDALEHWNVLISLEQNSASYYFERGVCKFNLQYKSAMEDFDEALRLEPENAYFHSGKAFLLDKLGRLNEAIASYQRSLELDPENEVTLNNMAITEYKMGNKDRAGELFDESDKLFIDQGLMSERFQPNFSKQVQQKVVPEPVEAKSTLWKEVKKVFSSRKDFGLFVGYLKGVFWKG